ncbi:hypothetical protein ACFV16_34800 [Streptomyces massasporeus]|uniref:hypothetical protein n=1 Tax=Streptomyces massasporeus TaxID=67324 RepID=UPI0036B45F18
MKTLSTRCATLAACTALFIGGTAVQASANDTAHLPSSVTRSGEGGDRITVTGNNNNTAGNDLIVGNNNTSGTGHTIGTVGTVETNCLTIVNTTTITLTGGFASVLGDATVTNPPSPNLQAGRSTTVCAAANNALDSLLTMTVSYQLPGPTSEIPSSQVEFTIANDTPTGECAYVSLTPTSPWQAQAVCQTNTDYYSQGYATIGI